MSGPEDERPPMKPWKKWLLRTLAVVVISFGVYFVYGWWQQSSARARLEEARAHLDATDPGWRLDEIQAARAKAFPPDEENITKLAVKIKDDTPKEFEQFLIRADDPEPWLPTPEMNRLPNVEKLAEARRIRTLCQDVIDRTLKLGTLKSGGVIPPPVPNPLDISLEHTQRLRNTAALLSLNATVLAADKDVNGAITSCRAGLNLVNGVGDEPTILSTLVRLAVAAVAVNAAERTLGYGEPQTGLRELQEELLSEAKGSKLVIGLRGERAIFNALFDHFATNPNALDNLGNPTNPLVSLSRFAYRSHLLTNHLEGLKLQTLCMEIGEGPSHEWLNRTQTEVIDQMEGTIIKLLLPAYNKVMEAMLRTHSRLRCLAAGIACERFRQANGRWPKNLMEIPKEILAEVPRDPYVDEAVNYRVLGDGIVVYSVGPDGNDDDGSLSYGHPKPGEDLGTRLWSPEFRRRP